MAQQPKVYKLGALDHYVPFGYISQILFFTCEEPDVASIRAAVARLLETTPFLAGTVNTASDETRLGRYEVSGPFYEVDDIFFVRDLRTELEYTDAFIAGPHTMQLTARTLLAPVPKPVLVAQLTRLRGGCTLCWQTHHLALDGHGTGQTLRALAAICRGETPEPMLTNRATIEFYAPRPKTERKAAWEEYPAYFAAGPDAEPLHFEPAVQRVLWFSGPALAKLKATCSFPNVATSWVSTNDAMCAFLWRRVAAVRVAAGADPAARSVFGMSVDGRRRMVPPVPETFVGNSTINVVDTATTIGELTSADVPLRTLALRVRTAVQSVTDTKIRSLVTLLESMPDISKWRQTQADTETTDFDVTSWASQPTYSLDWGDVFGGRRVERVRMPWNLKQGIAWVMPAGVRVGEDTAGLEVVLMLGEAHMQAVVLDKEITEYATVVC